jgi:hypothetical protein
MEDNGSSKTPLAKIQEYSAVGQQKFQQILDKLSPQLKLRWGIFSLISIIYLWRMFTVEGWYIVDYGLGIYLLNQLIGFLSPQFDPEFEDSTDLDLPTRDSEEFRPFARRLPEFKFWYSCTRAITIAYFMTFFEIFNVPVFWPILLLYFIMLFFITMKRQIKHMIKHKYIPFSFGKPAYGGGGGSGPAAGGKKDSK